MNRLRRSTVAALGVAVLSSASCASRASRVAAPAEVILEIYNQHSYWVNASLVSATETTPLGRVGARDTRRWALPAQAGSIRVSVADSAGARTQATTLEAGKGPVVRWEVREP